MEEKLCGLGPVLCLQKIEKGKERKEKKKENEGEGTGRAGQGLLWAKQEKKRKEKIKKEDKERKQTVGPSGCVMGQKKKRKEMERNGWEKTGPAFGLGLGQLVLALGPCIGLIERSR